MARVRSPNYPLISLKDALEKASAVHKAESQNPVPREAIAKLMGFGGLNGRSDKVISAVSKYGLFEKVKAGDLRVSDLAVRILYPVDEQEEKASLREAAKKPVLFADIFEHWSNGPLPSDESLKIFLVRRGFNQNALDPVMSSFRDTIALVNVESDVVESDQKTPDEYSQDEVDKMDHTERQQASTATKGSPEQARSFAATGKPLVFDMETVSGSYSFDNADDLQDFINKLEKIKGLMPTKH